jgi:hypothetical protein
MGQANFTKERTIWLNLMDSGKWKGEYIGQGWDSGVRAIAPAFTLSADMMLKRLPRVCVHAIILQNEKPSYDVLVAVDRRFADSQDEKIWNRHGTAEIVDDWAPLLEHNEMVMREYEEEHRIDKAISSLPAGRHGHGHRRPSAAQKLGIEGRIDHADVSFDSRDRHGGSCTRKRRFSYLASAIKFAQKQRAAGQAATVTAFCEDGSTQQVCC